MRNEPGFGRLPIELMIDAALLRMLQEPCSPDEVTRVRQELSRRGYEPAAFGMNPPRVHVRQNLVARSEERRVGKESGTRRGPSMRRGCVVEREGHMWRT